MAPIPPSSRDARAWLALARDVAGLRVVSGTGEDLGLATTIVRDRHDAPRWVVFRETPAGPERRVDLDHVRGIDGDAIRLAGPREGFHITRVGAGG